MKKTILIISLVLIILIVSVGGVFLFSRWNRPLGLGLGLPTQTPTVAETTPTSTISPTETGASTPEEEATEIPTPTITATEPQPLCGGPPLMYILGIGADNDFNDYTYGLADVIRVARVDFVTPKVTVLTLPRDLWVEFPDLIEKYEYVTHGKLNQAYLYGGPGMGYYDGPGGGPGLLARTIAHNYGLYADHYGAVNMRVFEKIVDALDGIDIYLDQDWDGTPVDEKTENMGYFTAGQHHMTGNEALRFARIRKRYSTIARSDNQTLVMCALKDKLLSPSVVGSIPRLINSLVGEIQTDLTPAQLTQLACLLPKLSGDNLQFISFPDEMWVQGREYDPVMDNTTFVWDIPPEDIREFVNEFSNDAIPPDSDSGMGCP